MRRAALAALALAACADDARPRFDPDAPADAAPADAPDADALDALPVDGAASACCRGDAQCRPPAIRCQVDCVTAPDGQAGVWPEPSLPEGARRRLAGRVARAGQVGFTLETADGTYDIGVALPPGERLPLAVGEAVELTTSSDGLDQWRVEVTAADGPRLAALRERATTPRRVFGVSIAVEDVECGPNVIGDCLLQRNAAATLTGNTPRPLEPGVAADVVAPDGTPLRVVVIAAIIDENACRGPEERGPHLAALVLRDR